MFSILFCFIKNPDLFAIFCGKKQKIHRVGSVAKVKRRNCMKILWKSTTMCWPIGVINKNNKFSTFFYLAVIFSLNLINQVSFTYNFFYYEFRGNRFRFQQQKAKFGSFLFLPSIATQIFRVCWERKFLFTIQIYWSGENQIGTTQFS